MHREERQEEGMLRIDRIGVLIALLVLVTLTIWPLDDGRAVREMGNGAAAREQGAHGGPVSWGYAGPEGPANWSSLSPDYAACASGRMQSPIDIIDAFPAKGPALIFGYRPFPLTIVNNGHTVQVASAPDSSLTIGGEAYELLQLHFHAPSEHAVAGSRAPMEAHFVHRNTSGALAVVGVMIQVGRRNESLAAVLANMPGEAEPEAAVAGTTADALALLLPQDLAYFHYKGSLTTPPCTEGVHWFVMAKPVVASEEQVAAFQRIMGSNARPLRELNNRLLIASP